MKNILKSLFFRLPVVGKVLKRRRELYARLVAMEREIVRIRYMLYKYIPAEKRQEALLDWWREVRPDEAINLDAPKTFNEKIQWLKLRGEDSLLTRLADKFAARGWVSEKIGSRYLVPLLGVWNNADDIEFDALPDKFVLKATHGCGMNVIVTDKSKIDIASVRDQLNSWLGMNFAYMDGFEMQYAGIEQRIIAEEYMENDGGDIYDYKFWCFKGKCCYIQFLSERKTGLKMAFFDRHWNLMPFVYDYPRNMNPPSRPDNLETMIALAEKLAADFEHVRVDFYRLDSGEIRFGEMTFTSASGMCKWDPPEWNLRLGRMFDVRPGDRIDG